eukprot:3661199-Rhodomonas_salina.1
MVEEYKGKGRVLLGDSAFSSTCTAAELAKVGVYYIGPVKTATKNFPKARLQSVPMSKRGDTYTLRT